MSFPKFKKAIGIPVFGLGFTRDNQLIVGGGGGPGSSGIKNKLSSFRIDVRRKDLEEDAAFEFSAEEDAPMCLDVHPTELYVAAGVNGSRDNIENGENENCRSFKIFSDKFELEKSVKTLDSKKVDDFQRVARFSQDGTLLATGTTDGKVNVFTYPQLEPFSPTIVASENDEVLDVDISLEKEKLVCVLKGSLKLINLRGKNMGQVVQSISSTTILKNKNLDFRAFRYGRGTDSYPFTKGFGFAAANGTTKPGAYVVKYDAYTLDAIKVINVSDKPVTAFCISQDGALIAVATSDFCITILDAVTLQKLTKIKDAHSFSITCISISPNRRVLASASADNTCCIVSLPLQFPGHQINAIYTLLLALATGAILVWLTTIFDSDRSIKPSSSTTTLNTTTTSTLFVETPASATVESVIGHIITGTPVTSEGTIANIVTEETIVVQEPTGRDEL